VIVDACRNNPFADTMKRTVGSRAVTRGLARIEPAPNLNLEETILKWRSPPMAFKPVRLRIKKLLPRGFGDAPTVGREALPAAVTALPHCIFPVRPVALVAPSLEVGF
jgi:hypothetical protein